MDRLPPFQRNFAASLAVVAILVGCTGTAGPSPDPSATASGSTSSTASAASPTPLETRSPSAMRGVLVARPSPTSKRYRVALVSGDGRISLSDEAADPSAPFSPHLPTISTSDRRAFFLDGDTKILAFDGQATKQVGQVAGGPADRAVFAVSPDETRIAVTVIHYGPPSSTTCQTPEAGCFPTVSFRIYVEDLGTGANHVDILSPREAQGNRVSIPIGWRAGRLLVASSLPTLDSPFPANPYTATEYRVVDAVTAARLRAIGGDCGQLLGPITAAGTACVRPDGSLVALDWDGGSKRLTPPPTSPTASHPSAAALAPTGDLFAVAGADQKTLIARLGASTSTQLDGRPLGWLDADHLVYVDAKNEVFMLDLVNNTAPQPLSIASHRIDMFVATLPPLR